jgi:hypothetical protein
MREGSALHERAHVLYQRQKIEYGNLLAANDAFDQAQRRAQDSYMRQVKVARVALKNNRSALQKLGLVGMRKRAHASWRAQAQQFCANALAEPEILARLNAFGVTEAQLASSQRQINLAATSHATRQQRKGAAQDATYQRDIAMAALDAWMSDFLKVARVALQDRPQLLAQLGMTVRVRRGALRTTPLVSFPPTHTVLAADSEDTAPAATAALPPAERRNGRAALNGKQG